MKTLSENDRRFQDRGDLLSLLRASSASDLEIARLAIGLISERGFARDKDLEEVLRSFIELAHTSDEFSL